jgi:copper resistance protein C
MTNMRKRVSAAVIAAAVGVLLAVLLPASPAAAHDRLTASNPAAGSTVTTAIDTVTLTFSVPVKQQQTTVAVTGPDGVNKAGAAARSVDRNVLQVVGPLPTGVITVVWRTVSADGHAIEGTFTFTNAAPAPSVAASPSGPAQAVASHTATGPTTTSTEAADETPSTLWWLLAGPVLLAAAAGTWWYRRRA